MKLTTHTSDQGSLDASRRSCRGMTLIELLLAAAVGLVVLGGGLAASVYGTRSFSIIGNYSDMDAKSRQAIDLLNQTLHPASAVTEFATNSNLSWLGVTTKVPYGQTTPRLT